MFDTAAANADVMSTFVCVCASVCVCECVGLQCYRVTICQDWFILPIGFRHTFPLGLEMYSRLNI